MCMGIPALVLDVLGTRARCRSRHGEELVDLMLVDGVVPGTWLLCFLGAARGCIGEEEARRIDAALDALETLRDGGDASVHFADLIEREPQLPDFLRPALPGGATR